VRQPGFLIFWPKEVVESEGGFPGMQLEEECLWRKGENPWRGAVFVVEIVDIQSTIGCPAYGISLGHFWGRGDRL
jgi:hypothetical protein